MPDIPTIDIYPRCGIGAQETKGIKKLILSLLPRHTYMHVRTELPLIIRRLRSGHVRRQFKSAENLLVNVGAGLQGMPGWVNVDGWKGPNINCLYDCRKSLPFPDESVRGIFCE